MQQKGLPLFALLVAPPDFVADFLGDHAVLNVKAVQEPQRVFLVQVHVDHV